MPFTVRCSGLLHVTAWSYLERIADLIPLLFSQNPRSVEVPFIILNKDVLKPVSHPERKLIHFIISTGGDVCAKQKSFYQELIC